LRRVSVITVLAVAALVAVIFVVRGPGSGSGQARSPETSSPGTTKAATPEASTDEFCAAFEQLAAVHAQRIANDTATAEEAVDTVGSQVLAIGARLPVSESIRAGLEAYVGDVMGEPSQATAAEVADFSTFLTTSCPPTY
jgi:hypothetical protein